MAPADTKPVTVLSHERSGTHFLMNAIAAEFGYASHPHVSLDRPVVHINFFHPPSIAQFYAKSEADKAALIRKSHHQFSFFAPVIDAVLAHSHLFYIYRDPRDVMHSFRHFLNSWAWFEGPKVAVAGDFIRAAPAGQMLRYQYHQLPDMLDRWRVHVEGWLDAELQWPAIEVVRYEELVEDYDAVIDRIASAKGWTRLHGARPERDRNTVLKSKRASPSNAYTAADLEFFRTRIGPTMRRLGYEVRAP